MKVNLRTQWKAMWFLNCLYSRLSTLVEIEDSRILGV